MESAFGIEHNEVSKGVPKGLTQVVARNPQARGSLMNPTKKEKQAEWARNRMQAHTEGRTAGRFQQLSYGRDVSRTRGSRARTLTRIGA